MIIEESDRLYGLKALANGAHPDMVYAVGIESDVEGVNSGRLARDLFVDRRAATLEVMGVKQGAIQHSVLYTLSNGEVLAPAIECSYRGREANSEVGRDIGFAMGGALSVGEVPDSLRAASVVLRTCQYTGEVVIPISESGASTSIYLTHCPFLMAAYVSLCVSGLTGVMEFLNGDRLELELIDDELALMAYCRNSPGDSMTWPCSPNSGIVAARGHNLRDAKKRLNSELKKAQVRSRDALYRTDAGYSLDFVYDKGRYAECES